MALGEGWRDEELSIEGGNIQEQPEIKFAGY